MAKKKLLQILVDDQDNSSLAETAERLRLTKSTVVRLSLREGLTRIATKLSTAEQAGE